MFTAVFGRIGNGGGISMLEPIKKLVPLRFTYKYVCVSVCSPEQVNM